MQSLTFYETIPLLCKLRYFNMIILDVFSDFSSVKSEFCIEEKFGIKFGIKLALVSISYVTELLLYSILIVNIMTRKMKLKSNKHIFY